MASRLAVYFFPALLAEELPRRRGRRRSTQACGFQVRADRSHKAGFERMERTARPIEGRTDTLMPALARPER